jgi:hypothetical protein
MKRIIKDDGKIYSPEDVSIIGSYSSFLALLLIATILAIRSIFDELIRLYVTGTPFDVLEVVIIVTALVFGAAFLLIPAIPISITTRRAFAEKNRALGWTLIFISAVYVVSIAYQLVYSVIDKVANS